MSINTLPNNPVILSELGTHLIPFLPQLKISTYASQLSASGTTIKLQDQTITVTPNENIYVALSFSFGGLSSAGTATATISTAVNGGTAQDFTFPIASAISSNGLYSETVYYTFTSATSSAHIIATVSSTASVSGGGGISSMLVAYT